MKRSLTIISALLLASVCAFAQKDFGTARFDSTVHDFGRVNTNDGAVRCTFNVTNTGEEPLNIFAVTTTCSCTNVTWTRKEIAPGKSGTIDVTYSNDEGPERLPLLPGQARNPSRKRNLLHSKEEEMQIKNAGRFDRHFSYSQWLTHALRSLRDSSPLPGCCRKRARRRRLS